MGVGFMWRDGTSRTDGIRRISVPEMNKLYDEVMFMPQDEGGLAAQAFFAAAGAFRSSGRTEPSPAVDQETPSRCDGAGQISAKLS
jgi:hypothetical protein